MASNSWGMAVKIRKGLRIVKRGQTWYREERVQGKPVRVSLETSDEREALRKAVAGPEVPARPLLMHKPAGLTLQDALEEYEAWYARNRRSVDRTLAAVEPFVRMAGPDLDARALTREHVQRWADTWADGHSPLTVKADFSRVRAFIRWIAARKEIPALFNVCRGIDLPRDTEVTAEAPSVEKVRAVLRKVSGHPWMGDFLRLLVETGARPSEILGIRGIDLKGKLLSIVPWEGRLLKNKWSRRTIELNDAAAEILQKRVSRMIDRTRPIFATPLGTVYRERSVAHLLRELLAGGRGKPVPKELDLNLYDLRHCFASEHAAPGPGHMPVEALGAYLGHSPASVNVLLRWYTDQNALRRGAPAEVIPTKEGKVVSMGDRG